MTNRSRTYYAVRSVARAATVVVLAAASIAVGGVILFGVIALFDAVTGR